MANNFLLSVFYRALGKDFVKFFSNPRQKKSDANSLKTVTDPLPSVVMPTHLEKKILCRVPNTRQIVPPSTFPAAVTLYRVSDVSTRQRWALCRVSRKNTRQRVPFPSVFFCTQQNFFFLFSIFFFGWYIQHLVRNVEVSCFFEFIYYI